jgi:hypothetical protein
MKQGDLFTSNAQSSLFDEERAPILYRADPGKVRAKLHRIIAEARAASSLPWTAERAGYYRTMVPQMSLWLPEDEAGQLRFEFESELKRLAAA